MVRIGQDSTLQTLLQTIPPPRAGPPARVWSSESGLACVEGPASYKMWHDAGIRTPHPLCDSITVLGHLVSDGRVRYGAREFMLRDMLRSVRIADRWHGVANATRALELTLAASNGRLQSACFDFAESVPAAPNFRVVRTSTPTALLSSQIIERADALYFSPLLTVSLEMEPDADCTAGWWGRAAVALAKSFNSWYPSNTLLPLPSVAACVDGRDTPNVITAPCDAWFDDVEVRLLWSDWTASGWRRVQRAMAIFGVGVQGRRSSDRAYDEDVFVLDVGTARGNYQLLNRAAEYICDDRCDIHISKSFSRNLMQRTFREYYGKNFNITPVACAHPPLHPACRRDGSMRTFAPATEGFRTPWWVP